MRPATDRGMMVAHATTSGAPPAYASISGEVTDIHPDVDLAFIDEISRKFDGTDYPRRTPREVFVITSIKVRASTGTW